MTTKKSQKRDFQGPNNGLGMVCSNKTLAPPFMFLSCEWNALQKRPLILILRAALAGGGGRAHISAGFREARLGACGTGSCGLLWRAPP